jgi:hypothetical protein
LLKGIGVGSLSQFAENIHPFLRTHSPARKGIRHIGFFEAVEDANNLLHFSILAASRRREARMPFLTS